MTADLTMSNEKRVAVAGDWHSNRLGVRSALSRLHRDAQGVHTVLHLGDFNLGADRPWAAYRKSLLDLMGEFEIERILVTPGNHDNWEQLAPRFAKYPDDPYPLPGAESIAFLPRGYRFKIQQRTFLSFGGAASLDQDARIRGKDWWPEEEPSPTEADRAARQGTADVMLTHEAVNGGSSKVDDLVASPNYQQFSQRGFDASRRTRSIVTTLWNDVRPKVLFHGHMHEQAEGHLSDGRHVYSLARDTKPGNIGILSLDDLSWTWL
jgi:predicted phosphodiesterase